MLVRIQLSPSNMGGYPVAGSGPDCKSGGKASVGSSPTPPTNHLARWRKCWATLKTALDMGWKLTQQKHLPEEQGELGRNQPSPPVGSFTNLIIKSKDLPHGMVRAAVLTTGQSEYVANG